MKKTLFILALLSAMLCQGQSLDAWAERLKKFGESLPQEEVFLHTDNTCYYLGDTICYKAYMRLSDGRPSLLSRLLYVELFNQDGYLVERQKVEMKQGQGHGTICLPDTLYAGYYELRAYTRWQLNWGETVHPHKKGAEEWFYNREMAGEYYRDYEKLYSRVFPVYSKPRKPGGYFQVMNLRPIRRYSKLPDPNREAKLSFYPEGGSLVAGTQCHVAYEVRNAEGEHLKGTLRVTDSKGQVVAESEVKHRGRGDFLLDCKADESYKAEFTWQNDHKQRFNLPKVEADGIALQAKSTDDGIALTIQAAGQAVTEDLGLTVSIHGIQKHFAALPSGTREAQIPMDALESGVAQVTLFNAEGRIWADRLVFVRRGELKANNVAVEGLKSGEYQPYSPISFTLQGEPKATLSVAVRDNASSDRIFDTGTMLTEMLLCSQLRGFVESPEYYFESDDDFHRYALDLLLLVQGWRRYSWHEMATPGAFELKHPYEHTEVLMGSVNKYTAVMRENEFEKFAHEGLVEANMDPDAEARAAAAEHSGGQVSDYSLASANSDNDAEAEAQENAADSRGESDMNILSEQVSSDADVMVLGQNTLRTNYELASDRFYENEGSLKREVLVHAEFTQPGAKQNAGATGDMATHDKGKFRIDAPRFDSYCVFFLDASDSTKWKKNKPHTWIAPGEDKNGEVEFPEYYVKLSPIHPRFVKPYDFYQQNIPFNDFTGSLSPEAVSDAIVMKQVLVGANKGGLRSFDRRYPAFVLDAYEAFNDVIDAGLCPGYFMGHTRFSIDIARNYIGDMNMERSYELEIRMDSRNASSSIPAAVKDAYNHLSRLDKVYVYTDYAPRLEGDPRYEQSNQPFVVVDSRQFKNDGLRPTWLNRWMLLSGFSVCEEVYQPDYSQLSPDAKPADYRRTLYWNPSVTLDDEGRATIQCYGNSQKTSVIVSAEGMTPTGQPQSAISYPERR